MSGLFGPNNQPIVGGDELDKAEIGGRELRYFKNPNRAETVQMDLTNAEAAQATFARLQQFLGTLDMIQHALMREVVTLRSRIDELERAANPSKDDAEPVQPDP